MKWLRCVLNDGMFSSEYAVTVPTHTILISFFIEKSSPFLVVCRNDMGYLAIDVIKDDCDGFYRISLPIESLEGERTPRVSSTFIYDSIPIGG